MTNDHWQAVLWTIWTAWCLQAIAAALLTHRFARRMGKPVPGNYVGHQPAAVVIVPFKGVDQDLAGGVASLCSQDYPDYRLLLVVDSEQDPACAVLRQQIARFPRRQAQVLVAGTAGPDEGQKVHNQLFAIDTLLAEKPVIDPDHRRQRVWVFADSDAVPGPQWLTHMTQLLANSQHGLVTGYRWLVPQDDGLWSKLASVMNSSVAGFLGRPIFNHAWGGSMALREGLAVKGNLRSLLTGALCDDYQFTRLCRAHRLRVIFAHKCLVTTPVHFTAGSFWNFAHRQYLLTRVYAPGLFLAALLLLSLDLLGTAAAWGTLVASLLRAADRSLGLAAGGAMLIVFAARQMRATMRARAVRRALGEDIGRQLQPVLRLDRWGSPLVTLVHWLVVVRTLFGRTMTWRGLRYRLYGPQHVRRLDV